MTDAERLGVIGVLRQGERYLLVERAAGLSNAGSWCFPGGHVEPGETSREAVVRELREELGIEVEPVALLGPVRVQSPRYRLDTWTVRLVSGELRAQPDEIAAWAYLTLDEIRAHPRGMPSNAQVLALLGPG